MHFTSTTSTNILPCWKWPAELSFTQRVDLEGHVG